MQKPDSENRGVKFATARRDFIKSATMAAAAAPLALNPAVFTRTRSCIIVGAGLAGLAAAYALKQEQWDVTLLEARERSGGRVLSFSFPGSSLVCELGAEWIGASHERMKALSKEFSIELKDHRFAASLMQDGKVSRAGEWKFSDRAEKAFADLRKWFEKATPKQRLELDRIDWWTKLHQIGFSEEDLRLRDLQDSTDFGESIRQVSAYAAAAEYFESSPENEMDFKMVGGNSRLIAALADRIGRASIRYNTPVEQIRQRAGKVIVRSGQASFTADACICAVPARALKHILFDPPLPIAHRDAIEQLQYARIIKNSVLFDERFWGAENFSLVSDVTSHYYFHSTKDQQGPQGILCSYAVGEKADVLASQGDERRTQIITRDLLPLSDRATQLAKNIQSYAWQRDRYTEGAYAVYRPGQWFTIRPRLQQPHGKVLFAGEHLADWQGFMEGAVNTGEAAAQVLIKPRAAKRRAG